MLKKYLFHTLLALVAMGILIMAVTGQLDWKSGTGFVQGEIDGTRIDMSAKFSARVLQEVGRDGAPVNKGDTLLLLDGAEMLPRVAQAQEALAQSLATLEKLRTGLRSEEIRKLEAQCAEAGAVRLRAVQNHKRCAELYAKSAISKKELEEAVRMLNQSLAQEACARAALDEGLAGTRQEDIAAAQANVGLMEAKLAEVQSLAEDLDLRSPIQGEISKILVKKGEFANNITLAQIF